MKNRSLTEKLPVQTIFIFISTILIDSEYFFQFWTYKKAFLSNPKKSKETMSYIQQLQETRRKRFSIHVCKYLFEEYHHNLLVTASLI